MKEICDFCSITSGWYILFPGRCCLYSDWCLDTWHHYFSFSLIQAVNGTVTPPLLVRKPNRGSEKLLLAPKLPSGLVTLAPGLGHPSLAVLPLCLSELAAEPRQAGRQRGAQGSCVGLIGVQSAHPCSRKQATSLKEEINKGHPCRMS